MEFDPLPLAGPLFVRDIHREYRHWLTNDALEMLAPPILSPESRATAGRYVDSRAILLIADVRDDEDIACAAKALYGAVNLLAQHQYLVGHLSKLTVVNLTNCPSIQEMLKGKRPIRIGSTVFVFPHVRSDSDDEAIRLVAPFGFPVDDGWDGFQKTGERPWLTKDGNGWKFLDRCLD